MQPFDTYTALTERVRDVADETEVVGYAPGGEPILAARQTGVDPAIVLTAGSHATEHAGVVAAVTLLEHLETDHELVVIPSRDPVGVSGVARAMEIATGDRPTIDSYDDVDAWIRDHGDVIHDAEDVVIGLVGDYCYASAPPTADTAGTKRLKGMLGELQDDPDRWAQLAGRRVFLVPGQPHVEATGDFDRLYTLVISPDGEQLHLNRFHGTRWAPPESRATTQVLDDAEPRLFVDIHEYLGDGNWISIRPKADPDVRAREEAIGRRMNRAHADAGRTQTPLSAFHSDDGDGDSFLSEIEPGLFDLDYDTRGEGYNATDYAAEFHGLAFTHETGMENPFEERVAAAVDAVETAVAAFEAEQ